MRLTRLTTLAIGFTMTIGFAMGACSSDDSTSDSGAGGSAGEGQGTGGGATGGSGGDDGATVSCEPGTTRCTGALVETCAGEGDAWIPTSCASGEACVDGACAPSGVCAPGQSTCSADGSARVSCMGDGTGYEQVDCPDTAPCVNGVCEGPVCNAGETRCDPNASNPLFFWESGLSNGPVDTSYVEVCVEGTRWERQPCDVGDSCSYDRVEAYDKNAIATDLLVNFFESSGPDYSLLPEAPKILPGATASCQATECNSFFLDFFEGGSLVCGDPSDPTVDPSDNYSVCGNVAPFGAQTYSTSMCPTGASCTGNDFDACEYFEGCRPGTTDCTDGGRSIRVCNDQGEWEESTACEQDGRPLTCREFVDGDAQCMDAVCAEWAYQEYFEGSSWEKDVEGACSATGEFLACDADGILQAPAACPDSKSCDGFNSYYDGVERGRCQSVCNEGDEYCTTGGGYRVCEDGAWVARSCGDDSCYSGDSKVYCGGQCTPGSTSCSGGGIITCGDDAMWSAPVACDFGTCENRGTAICVGQCTPGGAQCNGQASARTCGDDGLWTGYTACAPGTECRTNYQGRALGCVECAGAESGGNGSYGTADQTCSGDDVLTCGADNTFGVPASCGAGNTCQISTVNSGNTREANIATCVTAAPPVLN